MAGVAAMWISHRNAIRNLIVGKRLKIVEGRKWGFRSFPGCCTCKCLQVFTFIGRRDHSHVKNWDKHAGEEQNVFWQRAKLQFLLSHSVLLEAARPQASFYCLIQVLD